MNNKGFILLHGAGLGSFIWDEVKSGLHLPAFSVDFPNRNQGGRVNRQLHFEDYVKQIIQEIEKWEIEKLIIVAHSIGGCVGLKVAEYFESRIAGFVGIGAAIPVNGNSFISCLPYHQRILVPLLLKIVGTKPPKKVIERGLCNDLEDEQTALVVHQFTPESRFLYTEKCKAGIPDTNRFYIRLSLDKEFPLSVQDKMAKNLNAQKVTTLQSGHLSMLSRPEELADVLNGFYKDTY